MLGQGPGNAPEAASPGPPGLRVFPRRERPLAPERDSHPEGCRLFRQAQRAWSQTSLRAAASPLRGLVPGVPGTSNFQWLDPFQPYLPPSRFGRGVRFLAGASK